MLLPFLAASLAGMSVPAPRPPGSERVLQRWLPGEIRCGGMLVAGARPLRPYTTLLWSRVQSAPQTFRFRTDASGRPLSIARDPGNDAPGTEDIAPSLAASRLPAAARRDCTITYAAQQPGMADAPLADLISYSVTPLADPLPPEGWERIRPVGGDCDREPRTQWLVATSPDYARIPAAPGVRDWTLVGYDLDAKGRAVKPRPVTGTGNAALDKAAVRAIAASRQTNGPRRGCLNPYLRQPTRLAPPPDADLDALRPKDATCPRDTEWAEQPRLTYPEPWRRRAIEGWAIVAFDVAPWGAIGNVRTLAAEPADAFGSQAATIVGNARKTVSASGYTGCVERVLFRMGPGTFGVPSK